MKKRLIAVFAAVVMLLTLAVGCAGGTSNPGGDPGKTNANNAQLVVALNPILVYDDGDTVIAYNDVKNATKADFENSTLTTLHQSTAWQWVYKKDDAWKKRAVYTLDKWTNGSGAKAKTAYSYAFNNEGTTSLASYYAQSVELTPYGTADSVPDYGLLLSVSGSEEEAVAYTVQKDGILNVAEGVITAIQSVAGVNTGFLAEDGTARSASFRIMLNQKQVFSGTLCNSTASETGTAVTSLNYEQISDMKVTAGDVIFIAMKLNAAANTADDQTAPEYNEEDNWTTVGTEVKVPITGDESNGGGSTVKPEGDALSIFDGFDSRFVLLRSTQASMDILEAAAEFRENMEYILDTEVLLRNESHDESLYEIVIGPMEERPESLKVYEDLLNYRANNANDFIIRRVGTKVYIAASNSRSLDAAIDHFLRTFCSSETGAIPANYNYAYQAPVMNATIAGNGIGNYVISLERHPSTIVQFAAEELQNWVKENCGYLLPIVNLTDKLQHQKYEIQVGPQVGSVMVDRVYDTRFTDVTADSVGRFKVDPNGYMTGVDGVAYKAGINGNHLVINGGSAYAVSAAVTKVCADLKAAKALPKSYSATGTYAVGNYSLAGKLESGYDLTWKEDFSYDTNRPGSEINAEVREYWTISGDTTNGPTVVGVNTSTGEPMWDQQRRPGIYGENWWIWKDAATNNGYLLEITKKEDYGYDAGRLISQNKWSFRYGIWETRIVVGTRNGACSAVWGSTAAPDNATIRNEIDVYENFGKDIIVANYHTWAPDNLGGHINHNAIGHMEHTIITPPEGEHFWDTFHSISIEWTSTHMDFYWDGTWFDAINLTEIPSGQASNTIKFANGVGTGTYCKGNDPHDWMDEEYTALTGKTVNDFFEVQTIDFSYILQTNPEGRKKIDQSYIKYARSHPSSTYYSGFLSEQDGWTNAQQPK